MLKLMAIIISLICVISVVGCTNDASNTPEPQSTSASAGAAGGEQSNVTGMFTGQIDNNSIEIKLDSLPEESAYRAFAFTDAAKKQFEQLKLSPGEDVSITYREREGMQPLIEGIKRLAK